MAAAGGAGRAARRAGAKTGSAVKPTTTSTTPGTDPAYSALFGTTTKKDSFALTEKIQHQYFAKAKYTNEPAPRYAPMVRPGQAAQKGHTMFRGWIIPYSDQTAYGKPNPYRFTFPYNPDTVVISSASESNTNLALQPTDSTSRNILAVGGSIGLTFLIDRHLEVLTNTTSKYVGPGGTRHFRDFGTNYDLEFIYRVFNGIPDAGWHAPVAYSSNYGFLMPTTCMISLSKTLTWYAFPSNISIQHQKLTPHMVPMLTQVTLQFTNTLANPDSSLYNLSQTQIAKNQSAAVNRNARKHGYSRLNNGRPISD